MNTHNPAIIVTINPGFGRQHRSVVVPVDSELWREATQPTELSDDPFALMLASPGLYGGHGDAITIRKKVFKMRADLAQEIGRAVAARLIEAFGERDETDGYTKEQLR